MALPAVLSAAAAGAMAQGAAPDAAAVGMAAPMAPPDAAQLADPQWIRAGRQRFVQACAYCHGTRGEAGKTAAFETRRGWDPAEIHAVIANGRVNGANVMPSWKQSMNDETIWKLVAYIKSLSADAPAAR